MVSFDHLCLGAWWSPNLSCTKWVEENIMKARRAFFARGSGIFHGSLNPLSSKSIVEQCVFSCLLFGAESWILSSTLLQKLESFQAEVLLADVVLLALHQWLCSRSETGESRQIGIT